MGILSKFKSGVDLQNSIFFRYLRSDLVSNDVGGSFPPESGLLVILKYRILIYN
jgi:hypothetical protein